jgi:transposase
MKNKHIASLFRKQREKIRLKAGKLFKKGIHQAEVARKLGVTPAAVNYWHKEWKSHGSKGLKSLGHPGFDSKLTEEKRQSFKQAILKGPLAYGYETNLWTLPRLASVMKKVSKVQFSEVWTWHIVRGLGFTPQKPQVKAREQNKQAVSEWKTKTLPGLKKMGWESRVSFGI